MKFVWQRAECFREDGKSFDVDRGLSDFGGKGLPADTYPISDIEHFSENVEGLVAHSFLVEIALDAPVSVGDVEELALSHVTSGSDTPCHRDERVLREVGLEIRNFMGGREILPEGVDPGFFEKFEFISPNLEEFGFRDWFVGLLVLGHDR